jgi:hypothetical protein
MGGGGVDRKQKGNREKKRGKKVRRVGVGRKKEERGKEERKEDLSWNF